MRDLFYGLSLVAAGLAATVAAPDGARPRRRRAHYSVTETKVAKLLDDPAAADILKRLIPATFANEMFQTLGRDLTLKDIQQYEPARTKRRQPGENSGRVRQDSSQVAANPFRAPAGSGVAGNGQWLGLPRGRSLARPTRAGGGERCASLARLARAGPGHRERGTG